MTIDFLSFSEGVLNAQNESELFQFTLNMLGKFGYDNLVISSYDRSGPKLIQHHLPDNWVDIYFEKRFFTVDPAFKAQAKEWRPHTWSSIIPRDCGRPVRDFIGTSHECGLRHGVTASTSMLGAKLNFAASSSSDLGKNTEDQMLSPVFVMCSAYSARLADFTRAEKSMDLSPRELEAVKWICVGKKNSEIAEKMNISENTVHAMIKRISLKNDINGRVQIATTAILSGIVNL